MSPNFADKFFSSGRRLSPFNSEKNFIGKIGGIL